MSAGYGHSCGFRTNGSISCWGYDAQPATTCNTKVESTLLSGSGPGLSKLLYQVIQACQHPGVESSCEFSLLYVRCHCPISHNNIAVRQHR